MTPYPLPLPLLLLLSHALLLSLSLAHYHTLFSPLYVQVQRMREVLQVVAFFTSHFSNVIVVILRSLRQSSVMEAASNGFEIAFCHCVTQLVTSAPEELRAGVTKQVGEEVRRT